MDDNVNQKINELENRMKALENAIEQIQAVRLPSDFSNTFLVVDIHGQIQIVNGKPPEGYETPAVVTGITFENYKQGKYSEEILQRFRFPITNNMIFRKGYAIDPNSLEGKIIESIIEDQRRLLKEVNENQRKKMWRIRAMTGDEAIKYIKELKQNKS